MRSLLSRLAFWWAALAVGLSLVLPSPLGSWVAGLAAAAAAFSLMVQRGSKRAPLALVLGTPEPLDDSGLLQTAAMVVRSTAQSNDLPMALHGVARVLFRELGAEGLTTGCLDDAGALVRLDRFADPAARGPAPLRESMSNVAAKAAREQRVAGSIETGLAVPVTRRGKAVAWLEFDRLEMQISEPALLRLLELIRQELCAVAERCAASSSAAHDGTPMSHWPATRARDPQPLALSEEGSVDRPTDVLDSRALDKLRALDPHGENRLQQRAIRAFETSAARLIPRLRASASTGDSQCLQQDAAAMRSASASVGALALAQECGDIENLARDDGPQVLSARVEAMAWNTELVLDALRDLPVARS